MISKVSNWHKPAQISYSVYKKCPTQDFYSRTLTAAEAGWHSAMPKDLHFLPRWQIFKMVVNKTGQENGYTPHCGFKWLKPTRNIITFLM